MQIDGFYELPKEKRPPENIWDFPDKLENWFDRVFDIKGGQKTELIINTDEIE